MTQDNPGVSGGFAPGSRVAGYLLEEQIGQGGMAVVFRAHDERLDRTVALKILSPALAADEAFRQRFIRESRAAAAVDDPHIIPVFEAGESGGVLFIAMRYVRGGDVRSMAGQFGPLPPGRVTEIVSQVASALDAAHGRGLVHRDVKPANMLLDSRPGIGRPDHVYLSDFGLSKASLQATGLTGTGTFLGTLDYISPEQIEGKPVDGRADEYALACAAFELITGKPPFQRDDAMAIMYAQLSEPPPAVTSRRAGIPAEVDGVFATALAKAPADRYPSCTDFAEALREAFGIRPYDSSPGSVPSGPHPATRLVSSSGPEDAGAVGAGTVAAAAAGGRPGHPGTEAVDPGAVDPGGPRTVLAGRDDRRDTSPDLTAEHWEGGGGLSRRRPGWRSPGAIAAGIVLILVLAGGGFLAFHHNHGKDVSYLPSLALPGCTTRTAPGRTLSVANQLVTIDPSGDNPFGLQVSRDGKFVFAVTPTTVQVLAKGPGLALTPKYTYTIATAAMPANGATMTSDGKYLLVAAGAGIDVLSVADGEAGASSMNVGTLLVPNAPGNSGAVEVAVSPGNQFAFVTLKSRNVLAVFNLGRAIATGTFLSSTYVGSVQLGASPVGMALSPNGHWMYVTSYHNGDATGTGEGLLNVLNVAKAETDPAASVVAQVDAGCQPARVIVSPDGMTVWVTARGSNAVLGFSAALAAAGSRRALIAKVQVGQTPIGLALVDGGSRLVVADADVRNTSSAAHNLAVVNVAAALARGPALLGYIPSGALPREFATVPGGRYLLVSDNGSAQVQVVDVSKLP